MQPTPSKGEQRAWAKATGVLQVLPARQISLKAESGSFDLTGGNATLSVEWSESQPSEEAQQGPWAQFWANKRLAAKQTRNFAEADRIRGLLAEAGWDVRDNRDGTAEVQRR